MYEGTNQPIDTWNALNPLKEPGYLSSWDIINFKIKRGNIYAQVVRQSEIFPLIPKPVWLGRRYLKYAPKQFKILVKNSKENFPFPPFASPW